MKIIKLTRGLLVAPCALIASGVVVACGAEPGAGFGEALDEAAAEESVETAQAALSVPTDVCTMVNALGKTLPSLGGSAVQIQQLDCSSDGVNNLYYSGAAEVDGSLNDLSIRPYVTNGAYFCSIADSDGAKVDGTLSSGLGRFGLSSQFDVVEKDPSKARIKARRVGTLYMFGAPAKLEVQDMDFSFPAETSSDKQFWGGYMALKSDSIKWNFKGSATFPVGPVQVKITPEIHSRGPTRTLTNDAIRLTPAGATNKLGDNYRYDVWNACRQTPGCLQRRSEVSTAQLIQDHSVACPADIGSFTDGILPYKSPFGGAGCASQNFIHVNTLGNWFEFGRPGGGGGFNDEPDLAIASTTNATSLENNATFWAALGINAKFDAGIAKITLDTKVSLAARDGFAVRQSSYQDPDWHHGDVDVVTDLNAQTKADATIKATVELLGWLPPISTTVTIPLGDTGNRRATPEPAHIAYTDEEHTTFRRYSVKGQHKTNPDQARFQCLAAPAVNKAPVVPDEPGKFLKQVATNAVNSIHPCNVKVCPDGLTQTNYEWDHAQKKLVVESTSAACNICSSVQLNMCDASGNVLTEQKSWGPQPILIKHGRQTNLPGACLR